MGGQLQTTTGSSYRVGFSSQQQEFVTMRIGEQLFGISVMAVQDVLRKQRITKVPLAPNIVFGLLNIRGRIVTAISMHRRLGVTPPASGASNHQMNVVVEYGGELFSLMVDTVGDVMSLPLNRLERVPANMDGGWRELASGVYKLESELLVILDVDRIINF